MQAISLQVFVKRTMLLAITSIESEYSKAGMGGWWVSKIKYLHTCICEQKTSFLIEASAWPSG